MTATDLEALEALAVDIAHSNFDCALDTDPTENGFCAYQQNALDTLEEKGLTGDDLCVAGTVIFHEWRKLLAANNLPTSWV